MLGALLSLSLALYEDEALAAPATWSTDAAPRDSDLTAERNCGAAAPDSSTATSSPQQAGGPSVPARVSDVGVPPEDAYAAVDPADLVTSMMMVSDASSPNREGDGTVLGGEPGNHGGSFPPTPTSPMIDGMSENKQANNVRRASPLPRAHNTFDSALAAAPAEDLEGESPLQACSASQWGDKLSVSIGATIATPNDTAAPTGVLALLTSETVPLEQKIVSLMTAVSEGGHLRSSSTSGGARDGASISGVAARGFDVCHDRRCSSSEGHSVADASPALNEAASLLLAGLDMKAVLRHGELSQQHLRHLSLTRCDFSQVRWTDMTVEDCDVSRCIFYRAELHNVVFRRCDFTGCVMNGARCSGRIEFEDCDFRLAGVGLQYDLQAEGDDEADAGQSKRPERRQGGPRGCPHRPRRSGKTHGVRFVRCNFDLSDFQFSSGLNNAASFTHCSNTHLALRFPLRARGGFS
jgi:uncharacterized protein YjbI with pentapeptide repeats